MLRIKERQKNIKSIIHETNTPEEKIAENHNQTTCKSKEKTVYFQGVFIDKANILFSFSFS